MLNQMERSSFRNLPAALESSFPVQKQYCPIPKYCCRKPLRLFQSQNHILGGLDLLDLLGGRGGRGLVV